MSVRTVSKQIDLTNQSEPVNKYITRIDGNGIKVHAENNPTTAYTKIDLSGMEIYSGTTTAIKVASFGSNGAQIGKTTESYLNMDYHSMQLTDKEGDPYLYISDLRDADGYITLTTIGDGETRIFQISSPVDEFIRITIDGVTTSNYTSSGNEVTFATAPQEGAVIAFTFAPPAIYKQQYKAFTLGLRDSGSSPHPFSYAFGYKVKSTDPYAVAEGFETSAGYAGHSEGMLTVAGNRAHAEGDGTEASGLCAHAEGSASKALGDGSHAGGYATIAQGAMQTTIGRFNIAQGDPNTARKADHAFIIGNGSNDNNRSNALTVDWSGNLMAKGMAGMIMMFGGSTAPTGWLICDGSTVSRTTYAELFAVIGTTYGAGDGTTTFNLPDLRGRFPLGTNTDSLPNGKSSTVTTTRELGNGSGGAETVTLTEAQLPNITGYINMRAVGSSSYPVTSASGHFSSTTLSSTGTGAGAGESGRPYQRITYSFGSGNAHNNMPPFRVVNFIIATGKTS